MRRSAVTLRRALAEWGRAAVDLLYPPVCPLCHRRLTREDAAVCFACLAELTPRPAWHCPRCGGAGMGEGPRPGQPCRLCPPRGMDYTGVLSVCAYHDRAARCVQLFKYNRRIETGELMARLMIERLAESLGYLKTRIGFVSPVPLHWMRRLQRGFNQSDLLGRELAGALDFHYEPRLLQRTRPTKRQALVPRDQRAANVRDAFKVNKKFDAAVRAAGVLLIDDVVTSGHTIHECAKVLKDAGASEVWVASFARAGMDRTGDEE